MHAVDVSVFFFFQAEDGIRDVAVTGVQTCALPILEGELDVPQHLARRVHDLYFNPQVEEFGPRTTWSLSNAFTSAFKESRPDSAVQGNREAGIVPRTGDHLTELSWL